MASRLTTDLAAIVSRRRALGLAGIGLGGMLAACNETVAARAANATCLVTPPEIKGPFPADGTRASGRTISVLGEKDLIRRDIRSSFAGVHGTAAGVSLDCAITILDAATCAPLAGCALYLWQCDAAGDYSLYNRTDVNYLRGMQVSDNEGVVRFTSIVPGCYGGRAPHVHVELFRDLASATSGDNSVLVSQLAFSEAECAEIYDSRSEYGGSAANLRRWPAARDFAFSDASPEGLAAQTIHLSGDLASGYAGKATITLA